MTCVKCGLLRCACKSGETTVTAAGATLPGGISPYLNPYVDNVTNRAHDLALRSWNEDILPGINDTFVATIATSETDASRIEAYFATADQFDPTAREILAHNKTGAARCGRCPWLPSPRWYARSRSTTWFQTRRWN